MLCAAVASLLLYDYLFVRYYQKLFPPRGNRVVPIALTLAAIAVIHLFVHTRSLFWLDIPLTMAVMVAGLMGATGMNRLQALFGASLCISGVCAFLGVFAAVYALVFGTFDLASHTPAHLVIPLLALPCAMVFFVFFRKTIFPDLKVRRFLQHKEPLRFATICTVAASANLSLIQAGYRLLRHNPWGLGIVSGACVLALGLLVYIVYQSVQSAALSDVQEQSRMLEEQYNRQLRHYQSYRKHIENFQAFSHDLKPLMIALRALIRAGDHEKAVGMIDDIYEDMPKQEEHRKYSSNVILDALLQDVANICQTQQIRFAAHISIPRHTGLSTLDAIRIFSNVTNNALQACMKIPQPERFIEIFCWHEQQWVILETVNSYDGRLREENGTLLTTKPDTLSHGLGMRILKETLENLGGFVTYQADEEKKTFLIRVHIPRLAHQDAPRDSV